MTLYDWHKEAERPEERMLQREPQLDETDMIGGIIGAVLAITLLGLFIYITPQQSSSINVLHDEADSGWIVHFLEEKP